MRLPKPEPSLRVSVVVPAKDEEVLVGRCLEALAVQEGVSFEEYEVLLVLDCCSDDTEGRAREVAARHPEVRLGFIEGEGRGVGNARRVGMEEAFGRLMGLGKPSGLIASTDADTVVSGGWIRAQLDAAGAGARAIGGRIELEAGGASLPDYVLRRYAEQGRVRYRRVLASSGPRGSQDHWQFSGASLSLTAEAYERVGGLPSRADLEDEYLERALEEVGVKIIRTDSVRVVTSPRTVGRAGRGLAHDLAESLRLRPDKDEQKGLKT